MKQLLYKELKLAAHPTAYLFLALGAMLLIPSYPYFVVFMYMSLSVFFTFLGGRENKDVFFTVALPVRKSDAVKARCAYIAAIELAQIAVSVPFALLRARINPNGPNLAGIEANVAFYGLVFVMFALFNFLYVAEFYKTAYKAGRALLIAGTALCLYIVAAEAIVQAVPVLKAALDTTARGAQVRQIPILIAGILVFALANVAAYKVGAARFEKVDL